MCGRYAVYEPDELIEYDTDELLKSFRPNYNVAPGHTMPVITKDGLKLMKWGLVPFWAKDEKIGYKMINAKSETIFEKPTWSRPVKSKRILVPANGFYEWQKTDDSKQPYYIQLKDHELMYFAGIWDNWHEGKSDELSSYSIVTTTPNKEMESIHDRMPVILTKKEAELWISDEIDKNQDAISSLLDSYKDGGLTMHPVSADVGHVKNNSEDLIKTIS